MALFSTVQPSMRVRVLPRFPAQVIAGSGITITKEHGTYTIAMTDPPFNLAGLVNAPNDASAAAAGCPVGHAYRNGSVLMIRVT